MSSSDLNRSRCTGPIAVMTAMSGGHHVHSSAISPGPYVPISATNTSVPALRPSLTARASPARLLKLAGLARNGARALHEVGEHDLRRRLAVAAGDADDRRVRSSSVSRSPVSTNGCSRRASIGCGNRERERRSLSGRSTNSISAAIDHGTARRRQRDEQHEHCRPRTTAASSFSRRVHTSFDVRPRSESPTPIQRHRQRESRHRPRQVVLTLGDAQPPKPVEHGESGNRDRRRAMSITRSSRSIAARNSSARSQRREVADARHDREPGAIAEVRRQQLRDRQRRGGVVAPPHQLDRSRARASICAS